MAKNNDTGKQGEDMARKHLMENGYLILESNWRIGRNEADIIAYKDGKIVFVEVKTRSNTDFGDPESFVDRNKQRAYVKLANAYILQKRREEEVRFDIIAVNINKDETTINHLENAFTMLDTKR